jgi:hypothetical protein
VITSLLAFIAPVLVILLILALLFVAGRRYLRKESAPTAAEAEPV